MAWIESHVELGDHPKLKRLARELGVSRPCAVGHLHYLWWWAIRYAQDGSLVGFEPWEIADAAMWDGDADRFVAALRACGFLDGDQVHDWDDYAGKLMDQRRKNAERMRRSRSGAQSEAQPEAENARAAHVQRTQRARGGLPNRTVPNQTVPNRTDVESGADAPQPARELVREPVVEPVEVPVAEPVALRPVPKPKATLTELPADWEISDALWAWAEEHGLPREHVEFENEKFVDYHRGKGTKNKDWAACWRNWLRNAPQFSRGDRRGAGSPRVDPTPIRPRGSRVVAAAESPMPDGWWPTEEQMAAVRRFGLTAEEVEIQTREFVQTARVTGQTARDWHGKWQTRLRMVAQTGVAR